MRKSQLHWMRPRGAVMAESEADSKCTVGDPPSGLQGAHWRGGKPTRGDPASSNC